MVLGRTARIVAIVATAIIGVLASLWAKDTLVWRDDPYWSLVESYKRARPIKRQPDAKRPGVLPDRWVESVQLPQGVTATIEAVESLNPRATVTYSDAPAVHDLYQPRDYTTLVDVRIDEAGVYAVRRIELITNQLRLTRFDLTSRKVTVDRRVDTDDAGGQ